jgi:hypothetical protein
MLTLTPPSPRTFVYRKTKPFTKAEFKFKVALADYAGKTLLPKLQLRGCSDNGKNRYSGINARITADAVYLEAIMVNQVEWGGFGFDFARLTPSPRGNYNVSVRRHEDWIRAENCSVASASNYFFGNSVYPRASDWVLIRRGQTFETCVSAIANNLDQMGPELDAMTPVFCWDIAGTRPNCESRGN